MQASREWAPPTGTLGRILEETRRRIPSLRKGENTASRTNVSTRAAGAGALARALRQSSVSVIAELKRRSPSKGELNAALDAPRQAAAYERGGAAAISVLTEPAFFGGSAEDLMAVRSVVALPILRKDFHIDIAQLIAARSERASAVLLIARALSPTELPVLMKAARDLELETVIEVRTEAELERALEGGADIVGVNSRDLETLEVDQRVPELLIPIIPGDIIAIWESGVASVDDVQRASACGADAVLVGSVLSKTADAESLVRSLSRIPRQPRHG